VQHHIEQLRGIFDKLEIEQEKREALVDRLNELQKEVDRDRTRFDAYAALVVEVAGVVGETVERSKVLDVLNAIARVIWGTKKDQDTKRLPSAPPKRLESVRKHQARLQSFRSMRRIEARRKKASALRLRFSQSLASLRQRLSQAMVRSTIQRLGSTANPLT
jgi:hypothetical protein